VVRVIRSLIHPDDLARLVEREYDAATPVVARLLSRGFNDTYLIIDADRRRRVLRVYARDKYWIRSESDLLFELELLDHLAEEGVSVSHPYRRRTDELIGTLSAPEGERCYALFTYACGRAIGGGAADNELLGAQIARMHAAMDTFHSDHDRYHLDLDVLIDMPLTAIEPYVVPNERSAYAEVVSIARRLQEEVSSLPTACPAFGPIHADIHSHNLYLTSSGEIVFFDFDHCGYGWRAYDLAELYRGPNPSGADQRRWAAVLAGYESERSLSSSERDQLPALAACRVLWDVGDWLRAAHWNGDVWAGTLCQKTLDRLRQTLETRPAG
jgi:Ser/Thr protein kinase RdoA (MazF antagonist)